MAEDLLQAGSLVKERWKVVSTFLCIVIIMMTSVLCALQWALCSLSSRALFHFRPSFPFHGQIVGIAFAILLSGLMCQSASPAFVSGNSGFWGCSIIEYALVKGSICQYTWPMYGRSATLKMIGTGYIFLSVLLV